LNGGEEQQTTEKPEAGTTVYYTHHAAGKRSSAVFTCPKCGKHRLVKHFRRAEVLLPVNTFAIENHGHGEDYGSSDSEAASTDHDYDGMKLLEDDEDDWNTEYRCADCHASIDMVTWWFNRSE
jgi:DNA-directed RNA polymerase subunit RPC12/RpoP